MPTLWSAGRGLAIRAGYSLTFQPGAQQGTVSVTRRRVQLTLNVEIYDQKQSRIAVQRTGMVVDGEYAPPQEAQGRKLALNKLVSDIVRRSAIPMVNRLRNESGKGGWAAWCGC